MKFQAVATCLFGLEKIVEFELKKAGAAECKPDNGRVFFVADTAVLAKVNVTSRTAERILIVLHRFTAIDFDTLFEEVKGIDWEQYIDSDDIFPVKGYSVESGLTSIPAMQSVIKKAVVEKLKLRYRVDTFPEDGKVTKAIRFSMIHNECLIMLDPSGAGLHKRGYRRISGDAPIKETLAAGIVDLARVNRDSLVSDPFCGSGTLLIEAALRAKNIAPGIKRQFAAEGYGFFGPEDFRIARQEARDSVIAHPGFHARGSDNDPKAVQIAEICAKNAGIERMIEFDTADATSWIAGKDELIITNPPYGERLLSPRESERLLRDFFLNLAEQQYKGLYVISSNPAFESIVSKEANKRRKMYNGMIQCNLYMYF